MGGGEGHIEYRILRIVRAHADRLLDMIDGLVRSTVKRERKSKIAMRGGEVWVEIECALEFFYRLVGAAAVHGNVAEREMSPCTSNKVALMAAMVTSACCER